MKVTDFVGHVREMLVAVEPAESKLARLGAFLDGVESSVQLGTVDGNARVGRVRSRPRPVVGARRKRADGHDPRIPPVGSVIRRGEHEVTVLPNGLFEHAGKQYKSVSGPAAAIRNGQATSGFEYFRLFRLPAEFTGHEEPCVIEDGEVKEGGRPQGSQHEVATAASDNGNHNGNGHRHESNGSDCDGVVAADSADGDTTDETATRGEEDAAADSTEGDQEGGEQGESTEVTEITGDAEEPAVTATAAKTSTGGKARPKSKKGKKGKSKAKPKGKKGR